MKNNDNAVRIYLPLKEIDIRSKNRLFSEDNSGIDGFDTDKLENIYGV